MKEVKILQVITEPTTEDVSRAEKIGLEEIKGELRERGYEGNAPSTPQWKAKERGLKQIRKEIIKDREYALAKLLNGGWSIAGASALVKGGYSGDYYGGLSGGVETLGMLVILVREVEGE